MIYKIYVENGFLHLHQSNDVITSHRNMIITFSFLFLFVFMYQQLFHCTLWLFFSFTGWDKHPLSSMFIQESCFSFHLKRDYLLALQLTLNILVCLYFTDNWIMPKRMQVLSRFKEVSEMNPPTIVTREQESSAQQVCCGGCRARDVKMHDWPEVQMIKVPIFWIKLSTYLVTLDLF